MSIQFVFTIPIILYDLLTIGETYMIRHKIVTLQARQAGTQTYKTTCFPFRKAGGFLCLLGRLPQALANNTCSGTRSGGLRLRDQRSLTLGKKRSPPIRAAISHLLQTGQAAILCNFHRGYQRVLRRISVPTPFAFPLPGAVHRKHLRCQRGSSLLSS